MKPIYFDNASTTPIGKSVKETMQEFMNNCYGNPSSLHKLGFLAERSLQEASVEFARVLGCCHQEVYYTSGGTESNNTAIFGATKANRGNCIVTTTMEHPSVSAPISSLLGYEVLRVGMIDGELDVHGLEAAISKETVLVSVMHVNNETGVVQDIEWIGNIIKQKNPRCVFHVDGVQAFGKLPVDVRKSQVDCYTASAHKIHGPKGVGLLYVKNGISMAPLLFGGGQQKNVRPGTENTLGIVAFAKAAKEMANNQKEYIEHVTMLKEKMRLMLQFSDDIVENGGKTTSPYILNISFLGIRSEVFCNALEQKGIFVSAGSACSSHAKHKNKNKGNEILLGQNFSLLRAQSAVRFSFSHTNTVQEVETCLAAIEEIFKQLKGLRGVRT